MIVGARLKAAAVQAMTVGWHAENFRRAGNKFKNLDTYLKPPTPAAERRDKGGAAVVAMFRRHAKKRPGKGAQETGDGVQ